MFVAQAKEYKTTTFLNQLISLGPFLSTRQLIWKAEYVQFISKLTIHSLVNVLKAKSVLYKVSNLDMLRLKLFYGSNL